MKFTLSLTKRFSALLLLFAGITVAVLYLLVIARNEPINFGRAELSGNVYQRALEKAMGGMMRHRIIAQRALYGEKASVDQLVELQKFVDEAFSDLYRVDSKWGESLQFTDAGLKSRKREHYKVETVNQEWNDLKGKVNSLKPAESNDLHAHLIGDLRTMVVHAGDTSNLILDPDLDSYYLMDITLLALPQIQDRIQNIIVEIEPWIRRQNVSVEDRVKASVFVAMMTEADLGRVQGDFQTVLNEDPNFYGTVETLQTKLSPVHQKFATSYTEMIDLVKRLSEGNPDSVEKFIQISDRALSSSFEYWGASVDELDNLLNARVTFHENSKVKAGILSVLCLLISLAIAQFFMRYLIRNLQEIVDVLDRSSHEVSNASSQSASSATTLSEASTEQAASLQQTMASVEQISAMVSQNAESAQKTQEAVDLNRRVSEDGSRSVDEMLEAIGEIRNTNDEILTQMETSNKEFSEIVKIISEIGEKTNVINEIVFQTKLLSFNASVEAARAGEHGKGFAVVAEEVGNLAQMSGNAAKQITDMLSDSIKKVNEIVERTKTRVDELVEVGKDKTAMGQATAQKCRESLNKIIANAQGVAAMITEITHASKEQAQGIQEINKAISQLDQVTQQNSSVAQQSSAQADELSAEAKTLSVAVNKLVVFVEGGKAGPSDAHSDHEHHHHVQTSQPSHRPAGRSAQADNVVPFSGRKAKADKKSFNKQATKKVFGNRSNGAKKAVGANEIPSSQDPNFEEF